MKKTEAIVIAQETTKQAAITSGKDIVITIANNPLMQLASFIVFIELCQMIKPDGKHQLISDTLGSTIETVAITGETIKSLSGALGAALPSISGLLSVLK